MYIKIKTNGIEKYPYSTEELRQENPQTSFPATFSDNLLAAYGIYPVEQTLRPSADYTKIVSEGTPVFDGVWKQVWIVSDNPDAKQAAESLRKSAYRNESDPLFFKAQRGEATMQEWQDKVAEIKSRYPKD